ncbi:MAG: DUF2085 domain-containing protein [Anaerolineae bacterium]|nr:DUF2085 domain-containing protein [Anaerolineae bacterium]MCI0607671.1 DUF2085 domain-containing protein [Anaerolineae bacterium]
MKHPMLGLARHWLLFVNLLIALWVGLPWLAPVFMNLGWSSAAKVVYFLYSFQCHQLPERSYFLFGRQAMYSLAEIQTAWQTTTDPFTLRQFIGNPEMGWKVAWSDRMVSMYTSILFGGLLYGFVRKYQRPISFWTFAMLLLPMVIDGGTHMISDLEGIGQGFRDTNSWLQILTNNALSTAFYQGDALGSFNSWMRLITGILFGIALVGFAYPYINDSFADIVRGSESTLTKGFEE